VRWLVAEMMGGRGNSWVGTVAEEGWARVRGEELVAHKIPSQSSHVPVHIRTYAYVPVCVRASTCAVYVFVHAFMYMRSCVCMCACRCELSWQACACPCVHVLLRC